jgi:hypothetical protein
MPAEAENPSDSSASVENSYNTIAATPVYQFDSDLDKGGSMSVRRLILNASRKIPLNESLDLRLRLGYSYADYNFSGPRTFAGMQPWDKVHVLDFGGSLGFALTPEWNISIAPTISLSREDDAGWGNAILFGGSVAMSRSFGSKLTLGFGAAAFSELEQVTVFPLLVVDWRITDRLSLANPFRPGPTGPAGLELSYLLGDGWDASVGAAYRSERFRLADSGLFADGIGESKSIPVWGRISRTVNQHLKLDFYGGAMVGGKVSIDDSNGNRLSSDDYDSAPFMALAVSGRF